MNNYSNAPLGFWQLLGQCFAVYPKVLKNIWYLLLAVVILTLIATLIFPLNVYIATSVLLLMSLAVIFLMAIALHMCDQVLAGMPANLNDSTKNAIKRYLSILGGVALLILVMVITAVIDFAIIKLGQGIGANIIFFILAFCFTIFAGLLFYFAEPLIVLERHSVLKSFEKGSKLFLTNAWRITGIFLIIHFITFLVSSFGAFFLRSPDYAFFYIVYGVIVQFFTFPLIMGMILVLLHDANLRLKKSAN